MTLFFMRTGSRPAAARLFPSILLTIGLASLASPRVALADTSSGRVVDPSGRPVAGALVLVDGPLGTHAVPTDADGRFPLPSGRPATYRLLVKATGLAADPVTFRVPGDLAVPLTITLRVAPISEAVVVLASQVPRPLSETPSTSTVVPRDEIEARQLETTADALRTMPGVTVARSGGRGALTSVFPRGGESDYTLVIIDGMRANTFGGGFDFSLLPFGDVAQVEVARGPQSALFGSDAIGGAILVTTRHGGPATASASIDGGSEHTWHQRAGGAVTRGEWAFGGGAERSSSDGFTGVAPASGERVSNDDWRSTNVAGSVGWTRGDATAVRGDVRWLDADRGNPGPFGSNPIGVFPGVDTVARGSDTDTQAGLSAHMPWGHVLEGRVQQRFQFTVADLDNTYRYFDSFANQNAESTLQTRRVTARAQTDVVASASTGVSVGVEALSERARNTFVVGEQGQPVPIKRQNIGTFAEVRQDLGARASVTAGIRVEHIDRNALEGDPSGFPPRPTFPDDVVTSVNPRVTGTVALWRDARGTVRTRAHASAGTGIRPPDAFEIGFTDNPSLKPERSRSTDVGVSHLITNQLTVDATYFHNRYDDLIVAVGSFSNVSRFKTDNISNARARGLELSSSWRGPRGLTARAAYTFMPTEVLAVDRSDTAPPPFTVGDPLIRRPRHQGSLDLLWTSGPISAFAEARARGRVLDVEPNFGTFGGLFRAPGFVVVDTGASWRLKPSLELYARGLNLLDRPYEEVYGYPALGRSFVGGVRVAFRP
jgi:outer membrane cobalamin receptor